MEQKPATSFNNRTSNYAKGGLLVVCLLIVAVFVWIAKPWTPRVAESLESVTIAASIGYAGTCPISVAVEKGYFASEGILITLQPHSSGKASLDATLRGEANLATVADVPVMFAAVSGQPVMVVASMFEAEKDYGVVGRRDGGISTAASFKGKRIGVSLRTAGHFVLASFLNRQKLSAGDVTMVDLKPEQLSAALSEGRIDAAATWEPFLGSLLAQLGANGVFFSGEGLHDSVFTLTGARDYVVTHPETIRKVLRAVIKGARFCQDVPDQAIEISATAMQADPVKLKVAWPTYQFGVTLDQSLLLALEDETRWAIKNKLTDRTEPVNYLHHIYLDAMNAVSPTTVTIIH